MTSRFGCLYDVMRMACDVRTKLLYNNNDLKTTPTATCDRVMADVEQVPDDDCEISSARTGKAESEVDEELLFDLEINQRPDGSLTGEDSDAESFHTCDTSSDLEGEQTTSTGTVGMDMVDAGSEDSGFASRRSRFSRKLRLDTLTRRDSNEELTNAVPETMTKSDDNEESGNDIGIGCIGIDVPLIKETNASSSPAGSSSYCGSWNESGSLLDLVNPHSPIYEEHEFHFNREELRRSTSLKADKTPPDTPRRKKVVRFADTLGLDLESVRHILNLDSPPRVPLSATSHLGAAASMAARRAAVTEQACRYLSAQFPQPGAADNFLQRVRDQTVCLENAMVTDMTITGTVRVANISYHKSVKLRYTVNNWATFTDVHTNYVPSSCDGPTDRFSFSMVAPADMVVGSKLSFCICYSVDGLTFWDSNFGQNYNIECYARPFPTSDLENAWMLFM